LVFAENNFQKIPKFSEISLKCTPSACFRDWRRVKNTSLGENPVFF
jgi:hypothetical protein